jgi:hypothetical protein
MIVLILSSFSYMWPAYFRVGLKLKVCFIHFSWMTILQYWSYCEICNFDLIEGKVVPLHAMDGAWGKRRCSFCCVLTLTLEWDGWSAPCPSHALPSGEGPPVPIVQKAGWTPEPVWMQRLKEKFSAFVRDWTLVIQSVIRRYNEWATRLTTLICNILNLASI